MTEKRRWTLEECDESECRLYAVPEKNPSDPWVADYEPSGCVEVVPVKFVPTPQWVPASQPPELHDRGQRYGAIQSDRVLMVDKYGQIVAGWAWKYDKEDVTPPAYAIVPVRWMAPSGWDFDTAYWMPIPALPEDVRS